MLMVLEVVEESEAVDVWGGVRLTRRRMYHDRLYYLSLLPGEHGGGDFTLAFCSSFVLLRVVVVVEEQVLGVLVAVEHVRVVVVEVLKYNMVVSEGCLLLLYV